MYCPKCSQQQISDEVRFCSRCGFSLSAVRELVTSDNALAEGGAETRAEQLSRIQKGVRKGARLMLASLGMTLIVGFLAAMNDDFAIFAFVPFICFLVGFVRILHSVFWADRASLAKAAASQPHVVHAMAGQPVAAARRPELSPPPVVPIESFTARRAETSEMVRPPSVTENTTKLLEEEADRNHA